ncbi:MAG: hypothetical protein V4737_03305 [Curtobacterium sp.]
MLHSTTTLAIGTLAVAALALTGCAQLSGIALGEATTHVETRADLEDAPAWMPADAEDITVTVGTEGSSGSAPSSTVFTSKDGVTSDRCTTVPRKSAPTMSISGAPDPYAAEQVTKCGAWSMTSEGTRWLAWTPNTEDEE